MDDTAFYEFGTVESGYAAPDASTVVNDTELSSAAATAAATAAANPSFGLMPPPPGPSTSPPPGVDGALGHLQQVSTDTVSSLPSPPPVPRNEPSVQHVSRFSPVPPVTATSDGVNISEKRSMDRYEEVPIHLSLSKRPRGRQPTASSSSVSSTSTSPPPIPLSSPPASIPAIPDPMFTPPEFIQEQKNTKSAVETDMMHDFKADQDDVEFMDAENVEDST